jgi:hypothetical protein
MKKVIIISPSGASGGQEALHQLCSVINTNFKGVKAYIHYYGPGSKLVHKRFLHYNVNITKSINDSEETLIVVPEIFAFLIYKYKKARVGIWWLSIDGFYIVKNTSRRNKLKEFLGLIKWPVLENMDRSVYNFYQSEYARQYLFGLGVTNLISLSDFTKEEFIIPEIELKKHLRENLVCYNPKKGYEITSKLMELYPDVKWIPLINLSPLEIRKLMSVSKVYIDFGSHPGKDRFPREAASSGIVVITNRVGSAGNGIDIPILDKFKFIDPLLSHSKVLDLIRSIFRDYDYYFDKQLDYRTSIRNERKIFEGEIDFIMNNLIK